MEMTKGLTSTGNIVVSTPQEFFDGLARIFNFTLDVCALPENAKCSSYYTPDNDGLSLPWGGCMVQSSLRKGNIFLGQERLRGVEEGLQRFCSHVASCQDRYKVVVGLGAGQGASDIRQRTCKVRRPWNGSAFSQRSRLVYERHQGLIKQQRPQA